MILRTGREASLGASVYISEGAPRAWEAGSLSIVNEVNHWTISVLTFGLRREICMERGAHSIPSDAQGPESPASRPTFLSPTEWCPENWILYQGKCLLFSTEKKSWTESKESCDAHSSRLLITRSWQPGQLAVGIKTSLWGWHQPGFKGAGGAWQGQSQCTSPVVGFSLRSHRTSCLFIRLQCLDRIGNVLWKL
uniref:C-type lectin domain-containing protein n=1 Tax=Anolis carolinensis TaxID=28377 RepID=A0A803TEM9_ANOCA